MKGDVVVLVHGARDNALWFPALDKELQKAGYLVRYASYGRYGFFEVLEKGSDRSDKAKELLSDRFIRVRQEFPDKPIHVIAHSFGTYLVTLLLQDRDRAQHPASDYTHSLGGRLLFCGSVADANFRFSNHTAQFQGKVINEVGTRDWVPAIVSFVTDHRLGAAGTYGFKVPDVTDRWHKGFRHSDFLTARFCRNWWIPILDGTPARPGANAERLPLLVDWMASYTFTEARPWLIAAAVGAALMLGLIIWAALGIWWLLWHI